MYTVIAPNRGLIATSGPLAAVSATPAPASRDRVAR